MRAAARPHARVTTQDGGSELRAAVATARSQVRGLANWIAAPKQGIKRHPVDFQYVRHEA